MQLYHHQHPFTLEKGNQLPGLTIAYHSWGTLNEKGDNVIWICHALTASSNAEAWWPNLIGDGLAFDNSRYFVVCANILGSCYGTTGPSAINPITGNPYYQSFPAITIRDIVQAHELLRRHLGITKIHLLVGGSMGGYQALEWCLLQPGLVHQLFLLVTSAKETAWGIAIHTAQRMAIELDAAWKEQQPSAGSDGLKVARAIGMITYRNYESFVTTQTDKDGDKMEDFKASSYIIYQGNKLAERFTAHSYYTLTKAMDTHNISRGRGTIISALQQIKARTLIIGIESDLLCPLKEQQLLAQHIPDATFVSFDSIYGHDGFLVESAAITHHLSSWIHS